MFSSENVMKQYEKELGPVDLLYFYTLVNFHLQTVPGSGEPTRAKITRSCAKLCTKKRKMRPYKHTLSSF